MGVLINTSLITSFLAGVAALFAPCCITVLLPTYFASIFRQRRQVFFMTFVFFCGILVVFLPLGLGFGGLGQLFTELHDWIFLLGGIFLLLLALTIFAGFHPALPLQFNTTLESYSVPAIFLLGIFSGLATACCAPVLAGVLALSVLPGSMFWGGMYALGYVLGMVVPLFLIALFLDRVDFTEKFLLFKRSIRLVGKEMALSSFLSGLMFGVMGGLILFLSLSGRLKMGSGFQATVNIYVAKYLNALGGMVGSIPSFLFPLLFVLILVVIIKVAAKHEPRQRL